MRIVIVDQGRYSLSNTLTSFSITFISILGSKIPYSSPYKVFGEIYWSNVSSTISMHNVIFIVLDVLILRSATFVHYANLLM